jgi:hypothetical protein
MPDDALGVNRGGHDWLHALPPSFRFAQYSFQPIQESQFSPGAARTLLLLDIMHSQEAPA